jgi:hypothetical protein
MTPMPDRMKNKAPAPESLRTSPILPTMIKTIPNVRAPLVLLITGSVELFLPFFIKNIIGIVNMSVNKPTKPKPPKLQKGEVFAGRGMMSKRYFRGAKRRKLC